MKPVILCIDDQAENLKIRTLLLEQFGCDTVSAPDHQSALRAMAEQRIDLLLIDYHLAEGQTGEDIARDIRVISPSTPLVMLTGDAKVPESVSECVDAVLTKGASGPREVLETIERLLPGTRLRPRRAMLFDEQNSKSA